MRKVGRRNGPRGMPRMVQRILGCKPKLPNSEISKFANGQLCWPYWFEAWSLLAHIVELSQFMPRHRLAIANTVSHCHGQHRMPRCYSSARWPHGVVILDIRDWLVER